MVFHPLHLFTTAPSAAVANRHPPVRSLQLPIPPARDPPSHLHKLLCAQRRSLDARQPEGRCLGSLLEVRESGRETESVC